MFDAIRPSNTVPGVGGATQFEAVEMGENDGRLAGSLVRSGRHQFDGLRLKPGGPEQWIVRETAIPTVVRSF